MRQQTPFLSALLFLMACGGDATTSIDTSTDPSPESVRSEIVEFQSSDGFSLAGTWFTQSEMKGIRPVLILIHSFDQDQIEWITFIPELVQATGSAVLTFDLRGHGLSVIRSGEIVQVNDLTNEDFNAMPLDVEAAISWVKTRPEADTNRIGVIGADIGANIAYVSAATYADIKVSVSISPEFRVSSELGFLVGNGISNFQPRDILYLAAFGDGYAYTSAQDMSRLTSGETRVVGLQGIGHGLALLNDQEAWNELIGWLNRNL